MAGKYDHIDFQPPESVANAAKRGLEYRSRQGKDKAGLDSQEAGKAGIGSGVQRASNLKNRANISPKVIGQMVSFFARHEKNKGIDPKFKGEPWKDKGYVSWLLWGSDPGKAWANKVLRQMEAADEKAKKTATKLAARFVAADADGNYMSLQHLRQMMKQCESILRTAGSSWQPDDWQEALLAQAASKVSAVYGAVHHRAPRVASDNVPTNPKLWEKAKAEAKAKFRIWPSAYGSGWAARWYKEQGGGWKKRD